MNTKMICDQLSVTPKMLRVYESHGIISPKRRENNYREYNFDDVVRIKCVVVLRELGFSIEQIKRILNVDKNMDNNYQYSFYIQLKAIERKIFELTNIKDSLQQSINEMFSGKADRCDALETIINIGDCLKDNQDNRECWIDKWNFDDMAMDYNEQIIDRVPEHNKAIKIVEDLVKKEPKDTTFLDVGCGTCKLWEGIGDTFDVTGLDNSYAMLSRSRTKLPWIKLQLGNILDDSLFSGKKFDVIISTFTLHHINYNWKLKAFYNLFQLLNDKGKLIIADRMFLDEEDRRLSEEIMLENGKFQMLMDIKNEYYTYINSIKPYIEAIGYKMDITKIESNIWLLIINK